MVGTISSPAIPTTSTNPTEGTQTMGVAPHITRPIPEWLEVAVSRRLITRRVASELCDWAYIEESSYHAMVEQRVYYRAVAGETTEAVKELASILCTITTDAKKHGKTSWGDEQKTIWRKTFKQRLLLDIRADVISKVSEYLPSLISGSEQPLEAAGLLHRVLDRYR